MMWRSFGPTCSFQRKRRDSRKTTCLISIGFTSVSLQPGIMPSHTPPAQTLSGTMSLSFCAFVWSSPNLKSSNGELWKPSVLGPPPMSTPGIRTSCMKKYEFRPPPMLYLSGSALHSCDMPASCSMALLASCQSSNKRRLEMLPPTNCTGGDAISWVAPCLSSQLTSSTKKRSALKGSVGSSMPFLKTQVGVSPWNMELCSSAAVMVQATLMFCFQLLVFSEFSSFCCTSRAVSMKSCATPSSMSGMVHLKS
mmetsp:Transcript_96866/g.250546  ORF Transcript_96866/g.250546 Transcript_96866/m.250546 type:complete len:252 (+) Transcript_96866:1742-2497(+)